MNIIYRIQTYVSFILKPMNFMTRTIKVFSFDPRNCSNSVIDKGGSDVQCGEWNRDVQCDMDQRLLVWLGKLERSLNPYE